VNSQEYISSEQLMLALARGDTAAFDQLVLRHQKAAWGIAYRFLGDRHEAEDVVQDAFLRLLEAAERYQPASSFNTYFYRVISRLCLDRTKRRRPRPLEAVPDVFDGGPDTLGAMEKQQSAEAVRAALDALPPQQRIAVVLRYYEALSYQNIASALETTPKAVERLLARARDRLQEILQTREDA
jgi:RNA polymerase sigma-70 factor (ECF subfamily)